MTQELLNAIKYICSVDAELDAIAMLNDSHKQKYESLEKKLTDREKSLKTICKLNRYRYHDDAIDVLSDVDSYDED